MNQTKLQSTAVSEDDAARVDDGVAARPSRWTAGRTATLVIGVVVALVALVLLGAGGTALWADRTQRDEGYVTTDVREFSTSGSALTTSSTEIGTGSLGWLYSPGVLDEVRIRVTPPSAAPPLFVGIGPSAEVDRYLAGVSHTVITELWGDEVETIDGGTPASVPGRQDFWVASATGPGTQTLEWELADGSWTVVAMNADGQPGLSVEADMGARLPAVLWVGIGVFLAGAVFMAAGILLIVAAFRGRREKVTV